MKKTIAIQFSDDMNLAGEIFLNTSELFYHKDIKQSEEVQLVGYNSLKTDWEVENISTPKPKIQISKDDLMSHFEKQGSLNIATELVKNDNVQFSQIQWLKILGFVLISPIINKAYNFVSELFSPYVNRQLNKLKGAFCVVITLFLKQIGALTKKAAPKNDWVKIIANQEVNARQWRKGELYNPFNTRAEKGNEYLIFLSENEISEVTSDLIKSCMEQNNYFLLNKSVLKQVNQTLMKVCSARYIIGFKLSGLSEDPDQFHLMNVSEAHADMLSTPNCYFFNLKEHVSLEEMLK